MCTTYYLYTKIDAASDRFLASAVCLWHEERWQRGRKPGEHEPPYPIAIVTIGLNGKCMAHIPMQPNSAHRVIGLMLFTSFCL